jgi:hypothetical protein
MENRDNEPATLRVVLVKSMTFYSILKKNTDKLQIAFQNEEQSHHSPPRCSV